jgi:hypothetical protein
MVSIKSNNLVGQKVAQQNSKVIFNTNGTAYLVKAQSRRCTVTLEQNYNFHFESILRGRAQMVNNLVNENLSRIN